MKKEKKEKIEKINREDFLHKVTKPSLPYLGTSQYIPQIKQFEKDYNTFYESHINILQSKINYLYNCEKKDNKINSNDYKKEINKLKQSNKRTSDECKDNELKLKEKHSKRIKREKEKTKSILHTNSEFVEKLSKKNIQIKRTFTDLKLQINQQKTINDNLNINFNKLFKKYNKLEETFKQKTQINNLQNQRLLKNIHISQISQKLNDILSNPPHLSQRFDCIKSNPLILKQIAKDPENQNKLLTKLITDYNHLLSPHQKMKIQYAIQQSQQQKKHQNNQETMEKTTLEFKQKNSENQKLDVKKQNKTNDNNEVFIVEETSTTIAVIPID